MRKYRVKKKVCKVDDEWKDAYLLQLYMSGSWVDIAGPFRSKAFADDAKMMLSCES